MAIIGLYTVVDPRWLQGSLVSVWGRQQRDPG